jgi:hypothetical protein
MRGDTQGPSSPQRPMNYNFGIGNDPAQPSGKVFRFGGLTAVSTASGYKPTVGLAQSKRQPSQSSAEITPSPMSSGVTFGIPATFGSRATFGQILAKATSKGFLEKPSSQGFSRWSHSKQLLHGEATAQNISSADNTKNFQQTMPSRNSVAEPFNIPHKGVEATSRRGFSDSGATSNTMRRANTRPLSLPPNVQSIPAEFEVEETSIAKVYLPCSTETSDTCMLGQRNLTRESSTTHKETKTGEKRQSTEDLQLSPTKYPKSQRSRNRRSKRTQTR